MQKPQQLYFMQDNAPGHAAAETRVDLHSRGIQVIFWPSFSPDLNPIESVWNIMKDWIYKYYPEKISYDLLRKAVREAWDAVPQEELVSLVESMTARCQAVIDANGLHIPF